MRVASLRCCVIWQISKMPIHFTVMRDQNTFNEMIKTINTRLLSLRHRLHNTAVIILTIIMIHIKVKNCILIKTYSMKKENRNKFTTMMQKYKIKLIILFINVTRHHHVFTFTVTLK